MSALLSTAAAAGPLAAGWSVHSVWMRRRIERARRDPLTGLHTRDGFTARSRRYLRRGPVVVLLADVNDFKTVNDTFGHAAGDAVLAAVGRRLAHTCTDGVAARLGGDEFAAVLTTRPEAAESVVNALRHWLCLPVDYDGRRLAVSVSVGAAFLTVAHRTEAGNVLAHALRRADEAMYEAKRTTGRTRVVRVAAAVTGHDTVNGRRAGRAGTLGGAR